MSIIDLRGVLHRRARDGGEDPDRRRRREDADLIRHIAAMVECGRLDAVGMNFEAGDGEINTITLRLRSRR